WWPNGSGVPASGLEIGILTLSGANTYTGATSITGGTISANKIVVSGENTGFGNAGSGWRSADVAGC
ncbi:MAG: autotransporter-associated beta strand repeat-containing protein, partial [Chthoniobacterales bacterium]